MESKFLAVSPMLMPTGANPGKPTCRAVNPSDDVETEGIKRIPLPEGLAKNRKEINTFVLQEKRRLLVEGKLPLKGYQISESELSLCWKSSQNLIRLDSPLAGSAEHPIEVSDEETEQPQPEVGLPTNILKVSHITLNHPQRDYSRRVIINNHNIFSISMYGNIQKLDLERSNTQMVEKGDKDILVQDACTLNGHLLIGSKEHVSVIYETKVVNHPVNPSLTCLATLDYKGGPTCTTCISGTDSGTILWTFDQTKFKQTRLASLKSKVNAIVSPREQEIIIACTRRLQLFDISENRSTSEGDISNPIHQLKLNTDSPHILATEVSHLDRQIQIYDLRTPLFRSPPVIEMGYRCGSDRKEKNSRFLRGDFLHNLYVRGYADGTVNLFDIRVPQKIVTTVLTHRKSPVTHAVFSSTDKVYAVGKNIFSYIQFN